MFSKIQPELLVSSLATLQCLLEEQLSQQVADKQDRQRLIITASQLIDLIKNIVPHSSLSPALLLTKNYLINIAKQATAISLADKAAECVVIIVFLDLLF